MHSLSKTALIAPCGMNCSICRAYLRERDPCPGCRASDVHKPVTRTRCKIKTCATFKNGRAKYCFQCTTYPCDNLKHLDNRYRTKYHMSMIESLDHIKKHGIRAFLRNEKARWTCPDCTGTICVHTGSCQQCGKKI